MTRWVIVGAVLFVACGDVRDGGGTDGDGRGEIGDGDVGADEVGVDGDVGVDSEVGADSEVGVDSEVGADGDVDIDHDTGPDGGGCTPVAPWSRRVPEVGGVVTFNEIAFADDGGIAWVELYNPRALSIDVSEWRLAGRVTHVFAVDSIVPARGTLLVNGPFAPASGALELRNNSGRLMDALDPDDAPLWPRPAATETLAKRDPATTSVLAEHWVAAPPTPDADNGLAGPRTLVASGAAWHYARGLVAADAIASTWPSWPTASTPYFAGDAARAFEARFTADNYFALYLGKADGSDLRFVGRDAVGDWTSPESFALDAAPGDHLFVAAWEDPGGDGDTQMLIGQVARADDDSLAFATGDPDDSRAFVAAFGPPGAITTAGLGPPPDLAAVASSARDATLSAPAAIRARSAGPWGEGFGDELGAASFVWPDTFDAHARNNQDETFALFRSAAPLVPEATSGEAVATTFAIPFAFAGDPAATRLRLVLDGDALVTLNGVELARQGLPDGPLDEAALGSGAGRARLTVSSAALVQGDNHLVAHVFPHGGALHFDLALEADTDAASSSVAPGPVAIDELMYHPAEVGEGGADWIELTNTSDATVDLSGWSLVDGVAFAFADGTTLAPGAFLVLANDAAAMRRDHPGVPFLAFDGGLANGGERLALYDRCGALVDEVRWFDGGRWPERADGGGSSLERIDARAPSTPEGWAASREPDRPWREVVYRDVARASPSGPDGAWEELVLGLLDDGEVLIDDLSVVADPDGAHRTLLADGDFAAGYLALGTHERTRREVGADGDAALHVIATGPTEHMHNQVAWTLPERVDNGTTYEIRYRARPLGGSDQLNTRLYFNRVARTTRLGVGTQGEVGGTPGRANSRAGAVGPSLEGFALTPVVPGSRDVVVVSVVARDPDGVAGVVAFAAADSDPFAPWPMTRAGADRWEATLPARADGTLVQVYVVATDDDGAVASFPAAGPASRALYRVDDHPGAGPLHDLRILMTAADSARFHAPANIMSNASTPVTVVFDGRARYDVGVRAKGSERGRPESARLGYSLRLDAADPNGPLWGVFDTVSIDRSEGTGTGQREIIIDEIMARAGSVSAEYNDLAQLRAPRASEDGPALVQPGRFSDATLEAQFGDRGHLFEYELVYYPLTTDGDGHKLPLPDDVIGTAHRDMGPDAEAWRYHYLVKNRRGDDDFAGIMALGRAWDGAAAADFGRAIGDVIDVDQWLRAFAFMTISGAIDQYGSGAQHNVQLFVRGDDGRVLLFPHDLDFYGDAHMALVPSSDLARLLRLPGAERAYYGHLHDILATACAPERLARVRAELAALLPGQPIASHFDFVDERTRWLEHDAGDAIATAYAPVAFSVTAADPLRGTGWIDVRTITLDGAPLAVTWSEGTRWTGPAGHGTVRALDLHGRTIATVEVP